MSRPESAPSRHTDWPLVRLQTGVWLRHATTSHSGVPAPLSPSLPHSSAMSYQMLCSCVLLSDGASHDILPTPETNSMLRSSRCHCPGSCSFRCSGSVSLLQRIAQATCQSLATWL